MLGDLNITLTGAPTKLLVALAFLYLFRLSTGWTDNSLVCIAQTPASFSQLTECWICLPRAKSIMDQSDPLVHPVRNFSQVPNGKRSSTRDPRLRTVMYKVRIVHFPTEENSNVSCLTLPLATKGEYEVKLGGGRIGIKHPSPL